MTRAPRSLAASTAAGMMLTSVPSETVPSNGVLVCTRTTSGGVVVRNRTGASDSRLGMYRNRGLRRTPGPTNGVSMTTPSRSGTPTCGLSTNSR